MVIDETRPDVLSLFADNIHQIPILIRTGDLFHFAFKDPGMPSAGHLFTFAGDHCFRIFTHGTSSFITSKICNYCTIPAPINH